MRKVVEAAKEVSREYWCSLDVTEKPTSLDYKMLDLNESIQDLEGGGSNG